MSVLRTRLMMSVALGVIALSIAGCPTRTMIGDINKNPGRYAGKEVTIAGRAALSFGAVGDGVFRINDGSGSMWVYSKSFDVPSDGSKVAVTGRITQGVSIGKRHFLVVLQETRERH